MTGVGVGSTLTLPVSPGQALPHAVHHRPVLQGEAAERWGWAGAEAGRGRGRGGAGLEQGGHSDIRTGSWALIFGHSGDTPETLAIWRHSGDSLGINLDYRG